MTVNIEKDELDYEEWSVVDVPAAIRLDVALTEKTGKSRSFIQNLIQEERVLVNGQVKKAKYKIQAGDTVEINIPSPGVGCPGRKSSPGHYF
jgi:23S rRNA pseudouridine1911/1915/1917 synthase